MRVCINLYEAFETDKNEDVNLLLLFLPADGTVVITNLETRVCMNSTCANRFAARLGIGSCVDVVVSHQLAGQVVMLGVEQCDCDFPTI